MRVKFEGRSCPCLHRFPKEHLSSRLQSLIRKLPITLPPILGAHLRKKNKHETHGQQRVARASKPEELPQIKTSTDTGPKLETIPLEILFLIVDRLDIVSAACLRTTNFHFHESIPNQSHLFTRCAQTLMSARLETDMAQLPRKVVCMFCKWKHDKECFSPTTFRHSLIGRGAQCLRLLERKPEERFCIDHVQFILSRYPVPGHTKEEPRRRWVQRLQLTCMHCTRAVSPRDTRLTGCVSCRCNTCSRAHLPRFERFGPWDPWGWKLSIDLFTERGGEDGQLFIVERGGDYTNLQVGS